MLRVSSCGSNAGMETSAPLINAVVNNAVPLASRNSRINQLLPQAIHILCFFSGRLAATYFEINVLRSGLFCSEIWKFIQVSYIIWLLDWEQQMMHRMSGQTQLARGKVQPAESIKMIMWYRSGYNWTASDAWRYNNPVYKLMTVKLQLMLINVLLDRFWTLKFHKVV